MSELTNMSRRGAIGAAAAFMLASQARLSAQPAIVSGMVPVAGGGLFYRDSGGIGPAIVLLHAATGSADSWLDYQFPAFAAAGLRVIAYSRRGHTGSPFVSGPDNGTTVGDLNAVVDFLKVKRFHILGTAAGGFTVPQYALAHPERLLSMTMACSQGGIGEPEFRAAIARISIPEFRTLPASFRELSPGYRASNPEGVARWDALEHKAVIDKRVSQRSGVTIDWQALGRIKVPALVIAGAADLYIPPVVARSYASRIPGSRFEVMPNSGHSAYWEEPELFNRTVLEFVKGIHAL